VGYGKKTEGGDNITGPFTQKYREDQARDDQGRWVDEGGGEDEQGGATESENGPDTDGEPSPTGGDDAVLIPAQGDPLSGYPIDLRAEEARGGHTIAGHVNVHADRLSERVQSEADAIIARGHEFRGLAISSFTSLDSATRLVNSTIAQNRETEDLVANGGQSIAVIEARFDRATGYQAYLPSYYAQPYIRDTFGVRAILLRDASSTSGYRVQSAFPIR
jgi:hypothetical protein